MSGPASSPLSPGTLAGLAALGRSEVRACSHSREVGTRRPQKWEQSFPVCNQLLRMKNPGPVPVFPCSQRENCRDAWEERAAILEFDGGWSRRDAEGIAARLCTLSLRGKDEFEAGRVDKMLAGGASPAEWARYDVGREIVDLVESAQPLSLTLSPRVPFR